MAQFEWHIPSLSELPGMVHNILPHLKNSKIWAFYGAMGAGKTTLIREICHQLGVAEGVTSPTFALVNEYLIPGDQRIYHFDFYRINHISEAFDLGYEDYFYSGNYCFIEWPEKISPLLPEDIGSIHIESFADNSRSFRLEFPDRGN